MNPDLGSGLLLGAVCFGALIVVAIILFGVRGFFRGNAWDDD